MYNIEEYYQRIKALNLKHYAAEVPYYSKAPLRRVEETLLRSLQPGTHILDLGCGSGRFSVGAATLGLTVTGVDITPEAIVAAKKRSIDEGVEDRTTFLVGDMTKLNLPENTFDYVFCPRFSINAVATKNKRKAAINEMFRVVRPGGKVFVESFNKWYLGYGFGNFVKNQFVDFLRWLQMLACEMRHEKYRGLLPGDLVYPANKVAGAPVGYTHLASINELKELFQAQKGMFVRSIPEIIDKRHDHLKLFRYAIWVVFDK